MTETISQQSLHPAAVPPAAMRSYLINVAAALQHDVQPNTKGRTRARVEECITVLSRLAARATAEGVSKSLSDDALQLDAEEADAASVCDLIAQTADEGNKSLDCEPLEKCLRQHAMGGAQLRIVDAQLLAGGRSKQTYLVTQQGAATLPEKFIVRQDWVGSVLGTSVLSEFDILRTASQAGLRVPEPLLLETSAEVLGSPFLLMHCVEGQAKGDFLDPPPLPTLALEVAEQMGRLHGLGREPAEELEQTTAYRLHQELAGFRDIFSQLAEPSPTLSAACDWLEGHIDALEGPIVLVHGDMGFHNFLVHKEKLAAILDWEQAHIGLAAEDLGYVRGWVQDMLDWDEFLHAYHAAGGPRSTETSVDFYAIWAGVRLYSLLLRARAGILGGLLRDIELTRCSVELLPRLLHRLSCDLRDLECKLRVDTELV